MVPTFYWNQHGIQCEGRVTWAVCKRTVLFESMHNDVDAGGEVNEGALGLSVEGACEGTMELDCVAEVLMPLGAVDKVPLLGG